MHKKINSNTVGRRELPKQKYPSILIPISWKSTFQRSSTNWRRSDCISVFRKSTNLFTDSDRANNGANPLDDNPHPGEEFHPPVSATTAAADTRRELGSGTGARGEASRRSSLVGGTIRILEATIPRRRLSLPCFKDGPDHEENTVSLARHVGHPRQLTTIFARHSLEVFGKFFFSSLVVILEVFSRMFCKRVM